jgi:hypothetical protein
MNVEPSKTKFELIINQPLLDLMESCETFCVAGCYSVDAFDVSKEQIGHWISANGQEQSCVAATQLHELIAEVKVCQINITSELFNADWQPTACVGWLTQWETALGDATEKKGQNQ